MFSRNRLILAFFSIFLTASPLLNAQDIWLRRNLPYSGAVEHIAIAPNGDFFAQIFFVGTFRSTNEGISWNILTEFGNGELGSLLTDSQGILYATNTGGRICRSTDNGLSWEKNDYPFFCTKIAFGDDYRMYILTRTEGVWISDDSGRTAQRTSAPDPEVDFNYTHQVIVAPNGSIFVEGGGAIFHPLD